MHRILARAACSRTVMLAAIVILAACSESRAPDLIAPQYARPAAGGSGVKVDSTAPRIGSRGTTIDVRVFGSGFTQGFRALWALKGDTTYAVTRIKTNSTTYISSTELQANITIDNNASLTLYDVVTVGNGKKGIGIELFEVTYAFFDLGAVSLAWPVQINSSGAVVMTQNDRGAVWENGTVRLLPLLPGTTGCDAWDINDSGVVVGECNMRAVVWTAQGAVQELVGGFSARTINNFGVITGLAGTSAVVWTNGTMTTVGDSIELWDINDAGTAVGQNSTSIVWSASTGVQSFYDQPTPLAINSQGVVVGWAPPPGGSWANTTAFRWFNGTMQWLGTLPGGDMSQAAGINTLGQIVGYSTTGIVRKNRTFVSCCTAFIWTQAGGMKKVQSPSDWSEPHPYDINDSGWIVGSATIGGVPHAVLWKPSS